MGNVVDTETVPSINCPYCSTLSHATERRNSAVVVSAQHPREVSAAFQCDNCRRLVVATSYVPSLVGSSSDYATMALNDVDDSRWSWEPKAAGGKVYADVPVEISGPASEAHIAWSVGAYRASVLMARAVLEAGAKDKEVTSGTLYEKIKRLSERGHIRPLIADAAHEIRLIGNDMAHGDFATSVVTRDEAAEVLDLLDVYIAEMYELPGKIARRKKARES